MSKKALMMSLGIFLTGCVTADKVPNMTKLPTSTSEYTTAQIHHICYAESIVGGSAPTPIIYQTSQQKPAPKYNTTCYSSRLGAQCYSTPMPYNASFGDSFAKSFNESTARSDSKPKFSKPHYTSCLAKYGYVLSD